MKRHLSVADLARDDRFERMRIEDLVFDPRNALALEDDQEARRVHARRARRRPTRPAR